MYRGLLLRFVFALLVTACHDNESITQVESRDVIVLADEAPPYVTQPRFTVDVNVSGQLRPGSIVQVHATITSLVLTENAEIHVAMPEIQNARANGWGPSYRMPQGHVPSVASRRLAMASGHSTSATATVRIEAPGYYRVVVSANSKELTSPRAGNARLANFVSKELWLWITPAGGKITPSFDTRLFPDSVQKQPGPFRSKARRSAVSNPSGLTAANLIESGTMTWHLQYWNSATQAYEPASDVQVNGSYENLLGGTITPFSDYTDGNGNFSTPCENWYYTVFDAAATNSTATIKPNTAIASYGDAVCNTTVNVETLANESHVLKNMVKASSGGYSNFGYSHGGVTVYLRPSYTWSQYWAVGDSIQLYSGHIWGDRGAEVTAHEYGHSLHEKSLGGYPRSNDCPRVHGGPVYSDLQCALTEGFAEYFSVVVRPEATTQIAYDLEIDGYRDVNPNPDYPSDPYQPNGSVIEGAVGSFFLDLTDNTPTEDGVFYPGSYLATAMRTCQVVVGGIPRQNDGIDHLVYCLEKNVDSSIFGRFYKRNNIHPSAYSEGATEPAGWSASAIRTLWMKSLYNN